MKKYIALALVFATPAVLAETINMACPPGDKVVIHTVKNNGDGIVGYDDTLIMQANFGKSTGPDQPFLRTDLNSDGTTDLSDYTLFRMLMSQH